MASIFDGFDFSQYNAEDGLMTAIKKKGRAHSHPLQERVTQFRNELVGRVNPQKPLWLYVEFGAFRVKDGVGIKGEISYSRRGLQDGGIAVLATAEDIKKPWEELAGIITKNFESVLLKVWDRGGCQCVTNNACHRHRVETPAENGADGGVVRFDSTPTGRMDNPFDGDRGTIQWAINAAINTTPTVATAAS